MKKRYLFFFSAYLFVNSIAVLAQQVPVPIHFKNGSITPAVYNKPGGYDAADLQRSAFGSHYYVLLQFDKLPSAQKKQDLQKAGLTLGDYIPSNTYLATIDNNFDLSSFAANGVSAVVSLPAYYKIDPAIVSYKPSASKESKLIAVGLYPNMNKAMAEEEMRSLGAMITPTKYAVNNIVFIRADNNIVNALASMPFVSFLQLQTITDKPLNYKGRALHGMNALLSTSGRKLTGRNITVGIGDNAEVSTHTDFTGRLINRVYNVPSFHGIHTSGTVAGAGILDPKNHGMAPKATLVSQWFSDIITNSPTYVTDYNMIATNNSYTSADDGCTGNGIYDVLSNYADVQMKNYEMLLHVFSAGNDGTYTCAPLPAGYGTVKTGWQCAKNVLTVGAINQLDYNIANFSSCGPVADGRIKPEIVASGVSVFSTRQNNTYGNNSGTSMSGPIVAGATAVLNERYRQLNGGALPKASLLKALMCNTAEDLGRSGPDYIYGFGMLNARKAVEAMEGNQYFISSTPAFYNITVPAGAKRLKVMLYWADPAAAPNAGSTLVNDLDLAVGDPLLTTHMPLVLNPANVTAYATEDFDHSNNIEQVVIDGPVAGTYTMNVSAFNVPQGPQEYVLTYAIEMKGITVEYPFGGETLVPGETEVIRWTPYGDESKTFTVDYSTDNGTNWININNNVDSAARSLSWLVPATVTNAALMRVKRNSSVYTDQSDYNFVILGQPVVTATVPCEGYVQLDWPTITGATSYDILQLKGDSMSVIGNTGGSTYLVSGLNSNTTYWFGVAAKNGSVSGRRSVSKSALPSTGVCSLPGFDNNFKAVSIDAPVTGRQFCTGALTSTETIKFTIKNLDNISSSGSYDLFYQVNNNTPVMETSSIALTSLGTRQHSFTQTADLSVTGIYTIKAWVKKTGDAQPLNDTVTLVIKNIPNPVLTLPALDGFEAALAKDYLVNTIGLDSIDRADFKTNSTRGRARTFVNTGFALNGNRAITLDQFPYGALSTDSLLMTYNASNYNSGNQLRIDFFYRNHGQDNNPNNKVWIRGSDTQPWVQAYDLVVNQAALGQWKHASINVNDAILPAQTIGSSFQVKFGQQGITSANVANPELDQDDGYTFDDVSLKEALNDVAITQVLSPSQTGCNMSGPQVISVNIRNYSATSFNNVPIHYKVNGGSQVDDVVPAIGPNSTQTFNFLTPVTLSQNTDYSLDIWIEAPTDNYGSNDSVLNYSLHTSPVISTFPYLEGFESSDGNWYAKGSHSSWQWGTPAKVAINKAANGTKAWSTSLTGTYSNNELSYLYSPCFDLHTLTQPVLSFSHIFSIEDACPCDYTWIDYSTDGGITWNRLGTNGTGVNWFNDPTGLPVWRTSNTKWHVASIDVPTTASNVRFRFVMTSDGALGYDGVGIDDIHVFDKALIYTGPQLLNTTQTVSGSNWIHFTSGATRFASINPNGQNLGSTTVDVYPYAGAVRNHNYQYYLNRNIVVRPAIQPASNVSVRLYFTDAEAKGLIAATGCSGCSKPGDPYELGVTKYSGPAIMENGTLSDNLPWGTYYFILPANTEIVPYDNGYYAEFSVSSFSEFWLNNGGPGGNVPLPLNIVSFEAIKQNKKALLQWKTDNEINTSKFIIERSGNGSVWSVIGEVNANNASGINTYSLPDAQPLSGQNLYRLKLVDKDASFKYSAVRRLDFSSNADDITIYPNPVTTDKIFIASSGNCKSAAVYDAAGKWIRSYSLQGRNNTLDLSGIAKGIYQLKIITENSIAARKIIIE
jgi:hypothetical protein